MAKNYWDYDSLARKDHNGQIRIYRNIQAVDNALRNWLRSLEYEYIRRPGKGGPLIPYLTKPLDEDRASDIEDTLRSGLLYDFFPAINRTTVKVTPNYEKNYYEITIKGYVPEIKKEIFYKDRIKNFI